MRKFELTSEFITVFGKKLFRIKALISFGDVKEGDLGGYIEKEGNLNQSGNAWVYDNACVSGNAWVYDNACVSGNAWVYDNACVYGDARVSDNACVSGNACVYDNARVCGNARVSGNAWVYDNACVYGDADYATVHGFGSEYRTTTFYKTKNGEIGVKCGCFCGNLKEFREKVKETHGDSKKSREYLMIAKAMKSRLSEEKTDGK